MSVAKPSPQAPSSQAAPVPSLGKPGSRAEIKAPRAAFSVPPCARAELLSVILVQRSPRALLELCPGLSSWQELRSWESEGWVNPCAPLVGWIWGQDRPVWGWRGRTEPRDQREFTFSPGARAEERRQIAEEVTEALRSQQTQIFFVCRARVQSQISKYTFVQFS